MRDSGKLTVIENCSVHGGWPGKRYRSTEKIQTRRITHHLMKKAMFWKAMEGERVECFLCSRHCHINEGARGFCGVRENRGGTLYSLVYGRVTACNIDPIEKKPLYHFLPGTRSLSIATKGCNFRCRHCQNCSIARVSPNEDLSGTGSIPADGIVELALKNSCESISYTYTEPTVYFEYARDIARKAADSGLKNVFVTNGYITPEALKEISPFLDAANIDLKSFSDDFYRDICGAKLKPVLESIKLYRELGIWIEITTLVIPGHNDSAEELAETAAFIAGLGKEIPWHVSGFHPAHDMLEVRPTSAESLENACRIGREAGLKYVYMGNMRHPDALRTNCPSCGNTVIDRLKGKSASDPLCEDCGYRIEGVWTNN